jgi:ribosome maturation factor RimP
MSDRLLEQRINIKFCAKLGKSASETLQMLTEAYETDSMKKSSVFEWHKRFKEGWDDVKDDEGIGRLKIHWTDENVEKVQKLVRSDRRLSARMTAEELNLARETVRKILTEDLGMGKVSAKMVSRILSDDQKQWRLDVCSDLSHQLAEGNKFLDRWVMNHGAFSTIWKRNAKACNGKHQRHQDQKGTHVTSPSEDNAHLFFDHKGIVHFEFLEQGRTVN